MFPELKKMSVRSLVILFFVLTSCGLAIVDKGFRLKFENLVHTGLGGYLGQQLPRQL